MPQYNRAELIKEAIPYILEVGGFNNPEIDKYMLKMTVTEVTED